MQYFKLLQVDPIVFIARVTFHNPQLVLDEITAALASFDVASYASDDGCVVTFQGGFATLRLSNGDLLIEVEACDMVTCHGIKATIGGLLAGLTSELPPQLLWVPKRQSQG